MNKIKSIKNMFEENIEKIDIDELKPKELVNLSEKFEEIEDTRKQGYVQHNLVDIIMITLLAVLSNANNWVEIHEFAKSKQKFLKRLLKLKNGIPSHDTIQRVMAIVNLTKMYNIFVETIIEKIEQLSNIASSINNSEKIIEQRDILSMDGKESMGSSRKKSYAEEITAINTMSIYSNEYGISLVQDYIKEKSNEIPVGPEIIKSINVEGTIVTWDALNTQVNTVKAVIEGKGDYVGALKGNQHNFYTDVKDYFDEEILKELRNKNYKKTVEKSHNAVVTREYYMTNHIDWLFKKEKFVGMKSIGLEVKNIEKHNGQNIKEIRYFITSLENDIEDFSRAIRAHWGVENNLHGVLDIVFREDYNKTMEKNSAKSLGIIRRIALGILKTVQGFYKKSMSRIRYCLSLDFEKELLNIFKLFDVEKIRSMLIK